MRRSLALTSFDFLPYILRNNAQFRMRSGDPFFLWTQKEFAIPGPQFLSAPSPIPYVSADVEFVVQDAASAFWISVNSGGQPLPVVSTLRTMPISARRRHAFFIQLLGNPAGTLACGVPRKYPSNFTCLSFINCAFARSGFSRRDVAVAFSTGAPTVQGQPFERPVRSMSNLAQFLFRHGSFDGMRISMPTMRVSMPSSVTTCTLRYSSSSLIACISDSLRHRRDNSWATTTSYSRCRAARRSL